LKRTDHRRLMRLHAVLIAAARNSICLVLVGGMLIGSLFTLFVIPSIYMLIARDHAKDRERETAVSATDP